MSLCAGIQFRCAWVSHQGWDWRQKGHCSDPVGRSREVKKTSRVRGHDEEVQTGAALGG